MTLTKARIVIVLTVLAALLIGFQWKKIQSLQDEIALLEGSLSSLTGNLPARSARADVGRPGAAAISGGERSESRSNWSRDQKGFVIPRDLLDKLSIEVFEKGSLRLGRDMMTILEITPDEARVLEKGAEDLRQKLWDREKASVEIVEESENRQAYFIPAFPELGEQTRIELLELVGNTLGPERASYLAQRFTNSISSEIRTFSGFGQSSRLVEFSRIEGQEGIIVTEKSYDAGLGYTEGMQSNSYMRRPFPELPYEFKHLFEEVSEEQ